MPNGNTARDVWSGMDAQVEFGAQNCAGDTYDA